VDFKYVNTLGSLHYSTSPQCTAWCLMLDILPARPAFYVEKVGFMHLHYRINKAGEHFVCDKVVLVLCFFWVLEGKVGPLVEALYPVRHSPGSLGQFSYWPVLSLRMRWSLLRKIENNCFVEVSSVSVCVQCVWSSIVAGTLSPNSHYLPSSRRSLAMFEIEGVRFPPDYHRIFQ
jgi:hypothetical protein